MLKLTYTENGFSLEHLAQPLEEWLMARVLLALRASSGNCIEPITASFLLPADLPHLAELEVFVRQENPEAIALSLCDAQYIEVSLKGSWLTSHPEGEEGIFVVALNYGIEFFLLKLWQESQTRTHCLP